MSLLRRNLSKQLPGKVCYARDAIVSLIHDQGLTSGDRLPSFASLRQALGLGSQTISSAVSLLCEHGVLEARCKIGTFVKNPSGGHLAGRTVAVVVRRIEGSAYAATLASFLQQRLSALNCHCLTFYQSSDPMVVPVPGLNEFPGLEQAISERRISGVLTLCPLSAPAQRALSRAGLAHCFIGDEEQCTHPNAVVIGVSEFIREAQSALKAAGCRRIAQLCVTPAQREQRACGLPAYVGAGYDGGAAIAEMLLSLPPRQRPDGLISDDDIVVSGLLSRLVELQLPSVNYLPFVGAIIHRELGEIYPSNRMILFEMSLTEYARLATDLFLQLLQGKTPASKRLVYRFEAGVSVHPSDEKKERPQTHRRKSK